jgi:two-component sensor histidine kinase
MESGSPETLRTLDELHARIMAVAELYKDLYEAGTYDQVKLDSYCERVADAMVGLAKNGVSLEKRLESVTVPVKAAAPIGLIVTELITNSLKYAFPEGQGGTISISLKRTDAGALLEVRDDGCGLPAGFDPARNSGMGLKLVQALSEQIAARFKMAGGTVGTVCALELDLGNS